jgi:hypothetical protein
MVVTYARSIITSIRRRLINQNSNMPKYFLDTEFIEGFEKPLFGKKRHFIDLISIGIYCEDGRTFHALSSEYDYNKADDWVQKNVIQQAFNSRVHGDARNYLRPSNFHKSMGIPLHLIKKRLMHFFNCYEDQLFIRTKEEDVQIFGYFADYDWVLFCSLFGRMINLPKGFPMYCMDLKQMMTERGLTKEWKQHNCPDPEKEHDALEDAIWNYKLYNTILASNHIL